MTRRACYTEGVVCFNIYYSGHTHNHARAAYSYHNLHSIIVVFPVGGISRVRPAGTFTRGFIAVHIILCV